MSYKLVVNLKCLCRFCLSFFVFRHAARVVRARDCTIVSLSDDITLVRLTNYVRLCLRRGDTNE